ARRHPFRDGRYERNPQSGDPARLILNNCVIASEARNDAEWKPPIVTEPPQNILQTVAALIRRM
ncbi:MAG TPA: hypothetical protein PK217_13170, partial [Sphingopyxis terrae]|nr:hypothetical protein [Sphingopyxis terrae]